jgi:hypothetical protein
LPGEQFNSLLVIGAELGEGDMIVAELARGGGELDDLVYL